MQLDSYYQFFQSALSPETCQKIIDTGLAEIKKSKESGLSTTGWTYGNMEKGSFGSKPFEGKSAGELLSEGQKLEEYYIRDSEIVWLNDEWIYNEIVPLVKSANNSAGWNWEISGAEDMQFTVYNSPGGFYGWHRDGGCDNFNAYKYYVEGISPPKQENGRLPMGYTSRFENVGLCRKISVTVNLNSEGSYEGGNLKFDWGRHARADNQYHECTEIRPQGSVIVFPSYLYHCVTPVTKGTRYSLVLWALGRPFK